MCHATDLGSECPEAIERTAEGHVQMRAGAVVGPEFGVELAGLVQGIDSHPVVSCDPDVVVLAENPGVETGGGGADREVPGLDFLESLQGRVETRTFAAGFVVDVEQGPGPLAGLPLFERGLEGRFGQSAPSVSMSRREPEHRLARLAQAALEDPLDLGLDPDLEPRVTWLVAVVLGETDVAGSVDVAVVVEGDGVHAVISHVAVVGLLQLRGQELLWKVVLVVIHQEGDVRLGQ